MSELDEALEAAEAELAQVRRALREGEAKQGGRLEALAVELGRLQASIAALDRQNADQEAELEELHRQTRLL